jgi:eukaryotic-like serine/threonine-protein kinase
LHERVALKTIRAEVLRDPHALERFKREVHLAKQVTHPNVCRIFDFTQHRFMFRHQVPTEGDGGNESVLLVAMELLEGETLAGRLKRERKLSRQEAGPIALQMAGLGAAHEAGVLHRDFKPGNAVLTPVAKGVRAVITDFGLALRPGSESSLSGNITETGASFGTPAYMSPEQVEGKDLTPATDVYSLRLVLYQMLSGERPFDGTSPLSVAVRRVKEDPTPLHELMPDVNRQWDEIIQHCLERDPKQRFQTANEVAQALHGEIKVPSAPRRRRTTADIFQAGARQRKIVLPALGLLVAVAIVGLLYYCSHRPLRLTEKDTVILADFTNSTGDPVFDDTLKQTVSVAPRQSPFLNVISEGKVAATLELMTRPADASLTPEVAREVCQRTGSKAYITGGIAPLGQQYVLSLNAIDCHGGETLAQQQSVIGCEARSQSACCRRVCRWKKSLACWATRSRSVRSTMRSRRKQGRTDWTFWS